MDTLQTGIFDRFYDELGLGAAEALGGLGNCEAKKLHRGTVAILMKAAAGRRDATLTVARYPSKPETLATQNPSNGLALDVIGKARIRGWLELDQGIIGPGAIVNFEQLLALFPVGFRMQWHDESNIPTGWAIMDGVANAAGSGINRGGRVGYGYISGDPTFGTLGATVAISLVSPISGDGTTVSTSTAGDHVHEITGTEMAAILSVSSHAASSGGTHFDTADEDPVGTITPSPISTDFSEGSSYTVYMWPTDDGLPSVQVANHHHAIAKADVASALANHTVATGGSGTAETVINGEHAHTFDIDSAAAKLSIGTPTTVRPPGIVELWIEKLS